MQERKTSRELIIKHPISNCTGFQIIHHSSVPQLESGNTNKEKGKAVSQEVKEIFIDELKELGKVTDPSKPIKKGIGGPGCDFFTKISLRDSECRDCVNEIVKSITENHVHDPIALANVIEPRIERFYEHYVQKIIKELDEYAETIGKDTLPKFELTSFALERKKMDGIDGRPNFEHELALLEKKYKEDSSFQQEVEAIADKFKQDSTVATRYFDIAVKVIQRQNTSKGLAEKVTKDALNYLRIRFVLLEIAYHACLKKTISYYKHDDFPQPFLDALKNSQTTLGILGIKSEPKKKKDKSQENLKTLSDQHKTAKKLQKPRPIHLSFSSTSLLTASLSSSPASLTVPASESPRSQRSDSSSVPSSESPTSSRSRRSDASVDSKERGDSVTPKSADSDLEPAGASTPLASNYYPLKKSFPLPCPSTSAKKDKPLLSRSCPGEVSVPPPPSPTTTAAALKFMLLAPQVIADIAQSGDINRILEAQNTLLSLSTRSKSASPERRKLSKP